MKAKLTGKIPGRIKGEGTLRRVVRAVHRDPRSFADPPVARFVPVKAVGSFLPGLTRKSFEKYGFTTATLITDWAEIAGRDVASCSMPERLRWPRLPSAGPGDTEGSEARPPATLVVRVDPARALDIEYKAQQIVERINTYFGYRAVGSLRLIQAPVEARNEATPGRGQEGPARPPEPARSLENGSSDDPLAAALARLERGVKNRAATRKL